MCAEQPAKSDRIDMARRRYQKGSVSLRSHVWTGRYLEDYQMPDGATTRRHMRVYLGTLKELPTKKAAQRKLEPILATINTNHLRHVLTLRQFVVKWEPLALGQYKPGTARNFKSALRSAILPAFGDMQMSEIKTEDIQRFISKTNYGAAHLRNILKCMKAIMASGKAWGYISSLPFEELILPKTEKSSRHCFTAEELVKIIDKAAEPDKTLYWILAQTGVRIGEALALRWEDFNENDHTMSVRGSVWRGRLQSTKTDAGFRSIPLSTGLWNHIRSFRPGWRSNNLQLLFSARNGKPLRADRILADELHPLLETLGIKSAGYHSFRHANATLLDKIGAPMKVRQHRLGHANAKTTLQLYTHVIDESAVATANRFDDLIKPEAA